MTKYKTLENPTDQEIFDTSVNHMREQGVRAATDQQCMYRHGDLACAVGCLVDDELADELDNCAYSSIESIVKKGCLDNIPSWMVKHTGLLQHLQRLHDCGEINTREFEVRAEYCATKFGLIYTSP